MHTLSSTFILGYHGCDQAVAEKILSGDDIKPSQNDYDWLGPGIYFWEANPNRGLEYAHELKELKRPPKIKRPAVIGAVVDLGLCLDLTTSAGIQQVRDAYKRLNDIFEEADWELPQNNRGLLRRNLDCAVIRLLHDIREQDGLPPIDTIKGVFIEGGPVYPDSGFYNKTHIQVCACTLESIKGVFRVPKRFLR